MSTDYDATFVRFRRGFRKHLRHFRTSPNALEVYVWSLLVADHDDGTFLAAREIMVDELGLSVAQIKRALTFLTHGHGCRCDRCARLGPWDRPRYLEIAESASRGRPARYRILRHEALSDLERRAERAGQIRAFPRLPR